MIRFCHVMKNFIFEVKGFRVFWSKRGRWTASSNAGSLPGKDRSYLEAKGDTVKQAIEALDDALQGRKNELVKKIEEIDAALFDLRTLAYEAEELESVAEKKRPEWGCVLPIKVR
ncbi:hypothetical protein KASHIRA_01960 [Serratia phage vB_SmaM-Kashira]|nr:hypothetical protein KASHIRA_01960 [Serratia phage vB_SmaM-Kashira]